MRNVPTIARRELSAFFYSPVAWVVLTLFLLFQGYSFYVLLGFLNQPDAPPGSPMQLFFGGTFLFWIPLAMVCSLIPMRLLAEEVRSGTLEPLMTAPVTDAEVVLGKWAAAFAFYAALWVPTLFYVAILWSYAPAEARPELGPIATGYVGALLVGAAGTALGTLASAVTRNQIVAAVIAFVGFMLLALLGLLEFVVPWQALKTVVAHANLLKHVEDFGKGIVDSRAVVYLGSLVAFSLFGAIKALEARRWS